MRKSAPLLCLLWLCALCGYAMADDNPAPLPDNAALLDKALPSANNEVAEPGYRLSMPSAITTYVKKDVPTPWGKATMTVHHAGKGHRNDPFYAFRAYAFSPPRPLSAAKLRQARPYFLRHRKCVAQTENPAPLVWKNAQGKAWPQTLFAGHCAAPEHFMVLTAIVDKRVYQIQVVEDIYSVDAALQQYLTWMMDHISIVEGKNPR